MQQFNPIDAAMLYMEKPNTPFHVSTISIYDPSTCPKGPPSFDDIIEAVRGCLPGVPPFRRKIARVPFDLDYPYWVEDEYFDLEFHMRHLALPRPGNWKQFKEQISRLISRPMDLSMPPWEMWVIEGLDRAEGFPPGCFATLLKIHHCAIDGQTGVAMLNLLNQSSPKKKPIVLDDNWEPEEEPEKGQLLRTAYMNAIRRPAKVISQLFSNAPDMVRERFNDVSEDDKGEETPAPTTILAGDITARRVFDDVVCQFEDIKKIRKVVEGATVNDVCLTIVAEAMRGYLTAHEALPDAPLVSTVPIATQDIHEADDGGNQIAIINVSLHTDIADSIERLKVITKETSKKKAMQKGVVMKTMLEVVHNLPGALVGLAARTAPLLILRATEKGGIPNTMVTNVPGPRDPLYLLGAKMVHSIGCSPMVNGGSILHAVSSFEDRFMFSFTACPDLLKDADFYRDCIEAGIADVIKAANKHAKHTGS